MGGGGVMDEEGEEEAGGHNIKCQQISTPARRYQHDRPSCLRDDLMVPFINKSIPKLGIYQ